MTQNKLESSFLLRLKSDFPNITANEQKGLIKWLLEEYVAQHQGMTPEKLEVRYRILRQGYLHYSSTKAYHQLVKLLGALMMIHPQICVWVSSSRDKRKIMLNILQEVIQEMLNSDRHIQTQMQWIAQCTTDPKIRNILLFTALEEYCMSPVGKNPLLIHYLVNYLSNNVTFSQKISGQSQVAA